ncbi:GNAT family N-acetyltransferase [Barnesiella sp. An55]|uniref:GNAT family N-acetyltransferase n=1 Tax=Barnesiella sp. An55 TaxID=1965646 RepID=UPI000B38E335|nr:GNAT family N-acetyltransferase [Barnesiella sp. An55]OUN73381.1 GNAT family N-acetyltransferase [Barnesiella sp. An55]HIZ25954.1 GNAT family N-acetyltransferase [Candidatus Barnesiella merdipullorum]
MNYLSGKQIALRALEPEDLDDLYRWENDTSLWQYGCTVSPYSRYLIKRYIESYSADITRDNQLRLMIVLRDSLERVGVLDCFDYDATNRRAALGLLIDPNHTRRGLGRDALETFMEYAFGLLQLHQLYVHIAACNTASLALFRTCGFNECGHLTDWVRLPHGYADAIVLQKINPAEIG